MKARKNKFGQFEHTGWQRVAENYENTWGTLTNLFIPNLLDAAIISPGLHLLDVACGPGFVAESAAARGAFVIGVDFSRKMVEIAHKRLPDLDFREGDAQALDFPNEQFDVVAMNFGVLHLPDPPSAFEEAARVLKAKGRYVFSSWARPEVSPGARIVENAIAANADTNIVLPKGPDFFTYSDADEIRGILESRGFNAASMQFDTVTMDWKVPTVSYIFKLERDHGVRTAAVLAALTEERLAAIQAQIESEVQNFASQGGFTVPYAAHIITVDK